MPDIRMSAAFFLLRTVSGARQASRQLVVMVVDPWCRNSVRRFAALSGVEGMADGELRPRRSCRG